MIAQIRPLVEMIAAERTHSAPHLFEDAVQEGLIAAWKAAEARPEAPKAYVVGAARNGVRAVLRGRPFTGHDSHRGWQDAAPHVTDTEDELTVKAMSADHQSAELHEVWGAVKRLPVPDSHIATLRAYGYEWREVAQHVGLKPEATRRRFINHIAPRLAAELSHLKGAA